MFKYKNTLNQIQDKLKDLRNDLNKKVTMEFKNKKELDLKDKDVFHKLEQINSNAHLMFNKFFSL